MAAFLISVHGDYSTPFLWDHLQLALLSLGMGNMSGFLWDLGQDLA